MNPIDYIFLFGDYFVSLSLLVYFVRAYQKQYMSKYLICAFFVGCFIGSTWELTFHFLGDTFLHPIKVWPWGLDGLPKKTQSFSMGWWFVHDWGLAMYKICSGPSLYKV